MKLDRELTDRIARFEQKPFAGSVFRVTGASIDPLAPSSNGGRWAPRPNGEPGFQVLYTSLKPEGAIAEVASYLAEQTPHPSKPLVLHKLTVTTSKTIAVVMSDLEYLGVEKEQFGERNYSQTQIIGTAANFMGIDGLISPSARWDCNNLTIFMDHHDIEETLEAESSEEIDWQGWARENGLIKN